MIYTRTIAVGLVLTLVCGAALVWVLVSPNVRAQDNCTQLTTIGPETTDQRLGPFDLNRDTVRVSGEAHPTTPNGSVLFDIDLVDEQGVPAGVGASISQEGPFEENILVDQAGTYNLEIKTFSDVEYTVTAAECGASPAGGPANNTGSSTTPAPKTSSTPPKQSVPPRTSSTPPPTNNGTLMSAGGPTIGPVPIMPDGTCPQEFPTWRDGNCFSA